MAKILLVLLIVGVLEHVRSDPDCNQPPNFMGVKDCCKGSKPDEFKNEIAAKCAQFKPTNMEPPTPGTFVQRMLAESCMFECILNETTILQNGVISMDKVKTALTNVVKSDPDFIPIMEKAFETCDAKVRPIANNMPAPPPKPGTDITCKPYSAMIIGCVMRESFIQCPANKWTDSQQCNDIKAYMQACPPGKQ